MGCINSKDESLNIPKGKPFLSTRPVLDSGDVRFTDLAATSSPQHKPVSNALIVRAISDYASSASGAPAVRSSITSNKSGAEDFVGIASPSSSRITTPVITPLPAASVSDGASGLSDYDALAKLIAGVRAAMQREWEESVGKEDGYRPKSEDFAESDWLPRAYRAAVNNTETRFDGVDTEGLCLEDRAALYRINQFREASGLPLWIYDAKMTEMGRLHVEFVVNNLKAGRTEVTGHWENPAFPGYTKLGDEAARNNGVSRGQQDAVDVLEGLIGGPYHAPQYYELESRRAGVGFKADGEHTSGIHPSHIKAHNTGSPGQHPLGLDQTRFFVHPPPNWTEAPATFGNEWPNPLPDTTMEAGGIIAFHFRNKSDAKRCQNVRVSLIDETLKMPVSVIFTEPAKSVPSSLTMKEALEKWGPGIHDTNLLQEFVAIIPTAPLHPGHKYTAQCSFILGKTVENVDQGLFLLIGHNQARPLPKEKETFDVKWSISVRAPVRWHVSCSEDAQEWQKWEWISKRVEDGDFIYFEEGEHFIGKVERMYSGHIIGAGVNKTQLYSVDATDHMFRFHGANCSISDLTINHVAAKELEQDSAIYLHEATKLSLSRVEVIGCRGAVVGVTDLQAKVVARYCNFQGLLSTFFASGTTEVQDEAKATSFDPLSIFDIDATNYFGDRSPLIWSSRYPSIRQHPNITRISEAPHLVAVTGEVHRGDIIELAAGVFELTDSLWIRKSCTIRGTGIGKTVLKMTSGFSRICLEDDAKLSVRFEQLTLSEVQFQVGEGVNLEVRHCKLDRSTGQMFALYPNSTLTLTNCDLRDMVSHLCALTQPHEGQKLATVNLGNSNQFGFRNPLIVYEGSSEQRSTRVTPVVWNIVSDSNLLHESLAYACKSSVEDDIIHLKAGTHTLTDVTRLNTPLVTIRGDGMQETVLRTTRGFHVTSTTKLVVQDLTLDCGGCKKMFILFDTGSVQLTHVRVVQRQKEGNLFTNQAQGRFEFADCDFSEFEGDLLGYVFNAQRDSLLAGKGNRWGQRRSRVYFASSQESADFSAATADTFV